MSAVHDIPSAVLALQQAQQERIERGRLTDEWAELDVETAYRVQHALVQANVAGGRRVVGIKLGLTSRAKQQQMGVDSPLTAVLTDAHILAADQPVPLDRLIHPRAEPEIAFVLGRELRGPGVTATAALGAVESVTAAFEIIDSRFRDFSFALPDVIADNASAAFFVLGPVSLPPQQLDLTLEAVALSVSGEVVDTATGAAVQGHPAEALAAAANALALRGESIPAGSIVLTGALTDAVPLRPGVPVTAEFSHLGALHLTAE